MGMCGCVYMCVHVCVVQPLLKVYEVHEPELALLVEELFDGRSHQTIRVDEFIFGVQNLRVRRQLTDAYTERQTDRQTAVCGMSPSM